ncbi:hypothetical protein GCM10017567_57620 [Amycolatopsis bullii]|uniref:Uncharacterized protein n=1 Tax=Amycolatopsis bullii TaxID=941987 RepID=A0ABQ3KIZ0_9PSEU|nr:hypothetical protein GCM10017567_57620 [Amycolatopsis bullii]
MVPMGRTWRLPGGPTGHWWVGDVAGESTAAVAARAPVPATNKGVGDWSRRSPAEFGAQRVRGGVGDPRR